MALLATTLALLLAPLAAPSDVPSALAECDARVLTVERAERAYGCYEGVSRRFDPLPVVAHLEAVLAEHPHDGRLWMTLGGIALDHGLDPKPALRRAVRELAAAKLPQYEVQARLNLANRLDYEGETAAARGELQAAHDVAQALGHPLIMAIAELELQRSVVRYFGGGDVLEAYRRLEVLLDELPADAPVVIRGRLLTALRDAAVRLDRPREASSWSNATVELYRGATDDYGLATALRVAAEDALDLAIARHDPSGHDAYVEGLRRALAAARRSHNRFVEATAIAQLASVAEPSQRPSALGECARLAAEIDAEPQRTLCEAGLAVALATTDTARARRQIEATYARVDALGLPYARTLALDAKARVELAAGDLDAAWEAWSMMLDARDQVRAEQASSRSRGEIHAGQIEHFRLVAGTLLDAAGEEPRWQGRAFDVMERMHAREALRFLAATRLDEADLDHPRLATLDEVQRGLDDDEAMLVFQLGNGGDVLERPDGGSWVLTIEREQVRAHPLPPAMRLGTAAAMLTAGLLGSSAEAESRAAVSLGSVLLGEPLAGLVPGVRRLVIVPDGELHRLPFAALSPDEPGAPLVERFELSVVPSATLWLRLRESRRGPADRTLLALADPPTPTALTQAAPLVRALGRLRGGRAEAALAVATFGGTSELLLGSEASEAALHRAAEFSVVHIAAHAIVDRAQPSRSGVVLASDDTHDGLVSLSELGGLKLSGALVVLAACQGADGDLLAGEGPLSPARALFLADARAVVAGSWPVRDDDAAALFSLLYRYLDEGLPVAEALARAQRDRRAAGASPAAWAGFVVYGDGSMRVSAAPGPSRWVWMLLAATTVVLASSHRRWG